MSARQLWVGSCEMVAITARGSPLHSVVGDVRPGGALRAERARLRLEELRAVFGSAGLGALLPALERAQIATLARVREHTLAQLLGALATEHGPPRLSASQRQRLSLYVAPDVASCVA